MRNLRRPPRTAGTAAVVMAAMLWAAGPAAAHPHMCVGLEATVLFDKGAFTGLQQKWTFYDERYIAEAVDGLDKNKDGKLDRDELAELAKVNIDGLKELDYFTIASAGGDRLKLGEARDYWLEHTGKTMSLYFTVPFATPLPAAGKTLELMVVDPENYIAYGLPKVPASIHLGSGAPKQCRVAVELPDGEMVEVLKDILDALGCSITVPKTISIACQGS